jgi:hypothetical protein
MSLDRKPAFCGAAPLDQFKLTRIAPCCCPDLVRLTVGAVFVRLILLRFTPPAEAAGSGDAD